MSKKYILQLINMNNSSLDTELGDVGVDDFRKALVLALKEQDRDTRHACAEAIAAIEELPDVVGISKTRAHNACMNCHNGIVEKPGE